MPTSENGKNEQPPELSKEDDELLDSIWDKIADTEEAEEE